MRLGFEHAVGEPVQPGPDIERPVGHFELAIVATAMALKDQDRAVNDGWPELCASAFSAMEWPTRPLPSSKGWMHSKYR